MNDQVKNESQQLNVNTHPDAIRQVAAHPHQQAVLVKDSLPRKKYLLQSSDDEYNNKSVELPSFVAKFCPKEVSTTAGVEATLNISKAANGDSTKENTLLKMLRTMHFLEEKLEVLDAPIRKAWLTRKKELDAKAKAYDAEEKRIRKGLKEAKTLSEYKQLTKDSCTLKERVIFLEAELVEVDKLLNNEPVLNSVNNKAEAYPDPFAFQAVPRIVTENDKDRAEQLSCISDNDLLELADYYIADHDHSIFGMFEQLEKNLKDVNVISHFVPAVKNSKGEVLSDITNKHIKSFCESRDIYLVSQHRKVKDYARAVAFELTERLNTSLVFLSKASENQEKYKRYRGFIDTQATSKQRFLPVHEKQQLEAWLRVEQQAIKKPSLVARFLNLFRTTASSKEQNARLNAINQITAQLQSDREVSTIETVLGNIFVNSKLRTAFIAQLKKALATSANKNLAGRKQLLDVLNDIDTTIDKNAHITHFILLNTKDSEHKDAIKKLLDEVTNFVNPVRSSMARLFGINKPLLDSKEEKSFKDLIGKLQAKANAAQDCNDPSFITISETDDAAKKLLREFNAIQHKAGRSCTQNHDTANYFDPNSKAADSAIAKLFNRERTLHGEKAYLAQFLAIFGLSAEPNDMGSSIEQLTEMLSSRVPLVRADIIKQLNEAISLFSKNNNVEYTYKGISIKFSKVADGSSPEKNSFVFLLKLLIADLSVDTMKKTQLIDLHTNRVIGTIEQVIRNGKIERESALVDLVLNHPATPEYINHILRYIELARSYLFKMNNDTSKVIVQELLHGLNLLQNIVTGKQTELFNGTDVRCLHRIIPCSRLDAPSPKHDDDPRTSPVIKELITKFIQPKLANASQAEWEFKDIRDPDGTYKPRGHEARSKFALRQGAAILVNEYVDARGLAASHAKNANDVKFDNVVENFTSLLTNDHDVIADLLLAKDGRGLSREKLQKLANLFLVTAADQARNNQVAYYLDLHTQGYVDAIIQRLRATTGLVTSAENIKKDYGATLRSMFNECFNDYCANGKYNPEQERLFKGVLSFVHLFPGKDTKDLAIQLMSETKCAIEALKLQYFGSGLVDFAKTPLLKDVSQGYADDIIQQFKDAIGIELSVQTIKEACEPELSELFNDCFRYYVAYGKFKPEHEKAFKDILRFDQLFPNATKVNKQSRRILAAGLLKKTTQTIEALKTQLFKPEVVQPVCIDPAKTPLMNAKNVFILTAPLVGMIGSDAQIIAVLDKLWDSVALDQDARGAKGVIRASVQVSWFFDETVKSGHVACQEILRSKMGYFLTKHENAPWDEQTEVFIAKYCPEYLEQYQLKRIIALITGTTDALQDLYTQTQSLVDHGTSPSQEPEKTPEVLFAKLATLRGITLTYLQRIDTSKLSDVSYKKLNKVLSQKMSEIKEYDVKTHVECIDAKNNEASIVSLRSLAYLYLPHFDKEEGVNYWNSGAAHYGKCMETFVSMFGYIKTQAQYYHEKIEALLIHHSFYSNDLEPIQDFLQTICQDARLASHLIADNVKRSSMCKKILGDTYDESESSQEAIQIRLDLAASFEIHTEKLVSNNSWSPATIAIIRVLGSNELLKKLYLNRLQNLLIMNDQELSDEFINLLQQDFNLDKDASFRTEIDNVFRKYINEVMPNRNPNNQFNENAATLVKTLASAQTVQQFRAQAIKNILADADKVQQRYMENGSSSSKAVDPIAKVREFITAQANIMVDFFGNAAPDKPSDFQLNTFPQYIWNSFTASNFLTDEACVSGLNEMLMEKNNCFIAYAEDAIGNKVNLLAYQIVEHFGSQQTIADYQIAQINFGLYYFKNLDQVKALIKDFDSHTAVDLRSTKEPPTDRREFKDEVHVSLRNKIREYISAVEQCNNDPNRLPRVLWSDGAEMLIRYYAPDLLPQLQLVHANAVMNLLSPEDVAVFLDGLKNSTITGTNFLFETVKTAVLAAIDALPEASTFKKFLLDVAEMLRNIGDFVLEGISKLIEVFGQFVSFLATKVSAKWKGLYELLNGFVESLNALKVLDRIADQPAAEDVLLEYLVSRFDDVNYGDDQDSLLKLRDLVIRRNLKTALLHTITDKIDVTDPVTKAIIESNVETETNIDDAKIALQALMGLVFKTERPTNYTLKLDRGNLFEQKLKAFVHLDKAPYHYVSTLMLIHVVEIFQLYIRHPEAEGVYLITQKVDDLLAAWARLNPQSMWDDFAQTMFAMAINNKHVDYRKRYDSEGFITSITSVMEQPWSPVISKLVNQFGSDELQDEYCLKRIKELLSEDKAEDTEAYINLIVPNDRTNFQELLKTAAGKASLRALLKEAVNQNKPWSLTVYALLNTFGDFNDRTFAAMVRAYNRKRFAELLLPNEYLDGQTALSFTDADSDIANRPGKHRYPTDAELFGMDQNGRFDFSQRLAADDDECQALAKLYYACYQSIYPSAAQPAVDKVYSEFYSQDEKTFTINHAINMLANIVLSQLAPESGVDLAEIIGDERLDERSVFRAHALGHIADVLNTKLQRGLSEDASQDTHKHIVLLWQVFIEIHKFITGNNKKLASFFDDVKSSLQHDKNVFMELLNTIVAKTSTNDPAAKYIQQAAQWALKEGLQQLVEYLQQQVANIAGYTKVNDKPGQQALARDIRISRDKIHDFLNQVDRNAPRLDVRTNGKGGAHPLDLARPEYINIYKDIFAELDNGLIQISVMLESLDVSNQSVKLLSEKVNSYKSILDVAKEQTVINGNSYNELIPLRFYINDILDRTKESIWLKGGSAASHAAQFAVVRSKFDASWNQFADAYSRMMMKMQEIAEKDKSANESVIALWGGVGSSRKEAIKELKASVNEAFIALGALLGVRQSAGKNKSIANMEKRAIIYIGLVKYLSALKDIDDIKEVKEVVRKVFILVTNDVNYDAAQTCVGVFSTANEVLNSTGIAGLAGMFSSVSNNLIPPVLKATSRLDCDYVADAGIERMLEQANITIKQAAKINLLYSQLGDQLASLATGSAKSPYLLMNVQDVQILDLGLDAARRKQLCEQLDKTQQNANLLLAEGLTSFRKYLETGLNQEAKQQAYKEYQKYLAEANVRCRSIEVTEKLAEATSRDIISAYRDMFDLKDEGLCFNLHKMLSHMLDGPCTEPAYITLMHRALRPAFIKSNDDRNMDRWGIEFDHAFNGAETRMADIKKALEIRTTIRSIKEAIEKLKAPGVKFDIATIDNLHHLANSFRLDCKHYFNSLKERYDVSDDSLLECLEQETALNDQVNDVFLQAMQSALLSEMKLMSNNFVQPLLDSFAKWANKEPAYNPAEKDAADAVDEAKKQFGSFIKILGTKDQIDAWNKKCSSAPASQSAPGWQDGRNSSMSASAPIPAMHMKDTVREDGNKKKELPEVKYVPPSQPDASFLKFRNLKELKEAKNSNQSNKFAAAPVAPIADADHKGKLPHESESDSKQQKLSLVSQSAPVVPVVPVVREAGASSSSDLSASIKQLPKHPNGANLTMPTVSEEQMGKELFNAFTAVTENDVDMQHTVASSVPAKTGQIPESEGASATTNVSSPVDEWKNKTGTSADPSKASKPSVGSSRGTLYELPETLEQRMAKAAAPANKVVKGFDI